LQPAPAKWSSRSAAGAFYLWRAVDSEGEILDLLVQPKRNKAAALRLMRSSSGSRAMRLACALDT
jgi:transposase-like protein